jgi:glycosyltransferase involved in cell wall biosynthesis
MRILNNESDEKIQHVEKHNNVWLVIAAFNEAEVLEGVIQNALLYTENIIVVDDKSSDDTCILALNAGATVISHPINLGQGAALQTGIDFAIKQGADVIVTFDADGQHRIEDAMRLAAAIIEDEADIVCGSRFLGVDAKNIPANRRIFLKLAALFTRLTTGVPVTDAHNGLRALSRKAATSIRITQNRMAHASEIISSIKKQKLRYKELPVEIIYSEYSLSKGQRLSNSVNILADLFLGRISK